MSRFVKIGEAAEVLGVSIQSLRRWEKSGYLEPTKKSEGNTRYYDSDKLSGIEESSGQYTGSKRSMYRFV